MPIVCGVKFSGVSKTYYFAPGDVEDVKLDDHVIVETSRGKEMGRVAMPPSDVPETKIVGQLKPILRRASPLDLLDAQRYHQQEAQALADCQAEVAKSGLPMKVISAEYNFDGSRLTFYFVSEDRVDFRDLVRNLAHKFKTRIELRQIGVRDEARSLGGVGKCGRMLCCATWLTEFYPVSIRMAKAQDLPLSPEEISGQCGRLLCCLGYENDFYQEVRGRFPRVGKLLNTPCGTGKVVKVSVLEEKVTVLFDDGSTRDFTAGQLSGDVPLDEPAEEPLDGEDEADNPNLIPQWETSSVNFGTSPPAARTTPAASGSPETTGGSGSRRSGRSRSRSRRSRKPEAGGGNAAQREASQTGSQEGEKRTQGGQATRRRRRRRQPTGDSAPASANQPARDKGAPQTPDSGGSQSNKRPSRSRRRRPRSSKEGQQQGQ